MAKKIAYFDCIAGASGDMIVGAMLDAGLSMETLESELAKLGLKEFKVACTKVSKNGFAAGKFDVDIHEHIHGRHLPEINKIIDESGLDEEIKERSKKVFYRMCEAEAAIHDSSVDKVHLHELGGTDTIVDVVSAFVGLRELGIERCYVSPLPMGRGFVDGAHGRIPLPAPATVSLMKPAPVFGVDLEYESVTPTGAALLTAFADDYGPMPPMTIESVGYGAGTRDLEIPNLLRLFVGREEGSVAHRDHAHAHGEHVHSEPLVSLETNVDDETPEVLGYVQEKLMERGALDVTMSPILMKKGRPATCIAVLCNSDIATELRDVLFRESGSLGIRETALLRHSLGREIAEMETSLGTVRVKKAFGPGGTVSMTPEYEDCRTIARAQNLPLREVFQRVSDELGRGSSGAGVRL